MKLLDWLLPHDDRKRKISSVLITATLSAALSAGLIYIAGDYGATLFIFMPILMGVCSTVLFGYRRDVTNFEALGVSTASLIVFGLLLVCVAMEGVLCLVMAAPLTMVLAWLGSLIGCQITNAPARNPMAILLVMVSAVPTLAFVEKDTKPELSSVVSSVEIAADPQTVWKNVVEFPELTAPDEFIFKTGIAYPINAKIEGTGVGAVRHCNFTTGSFVEPVTVWDEPRLLRFDVLEQPAPMKEISFWDVNAPHLHDYFVSKQGQFKLTKLANGNTLLEGTTWYYHNIRPEFYWSIWSNHIVHKIHERVLVHIKKTSELETGGL